MWCKILYINISLHGEHTKRKIHSPFSFLINKERGATQRGLDSKDNAAEVSPGGQCFCFGSLDGPAPGHPDPTECSVVVLSTLWSDPAPPGCTEHGPLVRMPRREVCVSLGIPNSCWTVTRLPEAPWDLSWWPQQDRFSSSLKLSFAQLRMCST